MNIEARAIYRRDSIYGWNWELCEGTENMTDADAKFFIKQCLKDDKTEGNGVHTEYRIVGE